MMDILEYAMRVEREGEAHYRNLAERSGNPRLQKILLELADSEAEHYCLFKAMKEKQALPEINEAILPHVKGIFSSMEVNPALEVDKAEVELYRRAQEHEKKSQEFYRQKAEETDDPVMKEILLKIAGEEEKHYKVLGGIIDFMTRPAHWLEDAEWHHMDEY